MSEVQKSALLLFTKPPIAGVVKTRLTREKGGRFSEVQAADFYKRSMYDVAELCMHACIELGWESDAAVEQDPNAVAHEYQFFVCCPAEYETQMHETFEDIGPWPMDITYLTDSGETFDDHFDDAFAQIFGSGFDHIVSVGGDIPTLTKRHIKESYRFLHNQRALGVDGFVQAPCQECGTSLVGWSSNTPIDNQGIYYNMDGQPALDGYMIKVRINKIPTMYLDPIPDVDETTDLAHAISCLRAIETAAWSRPDDTSIFVARRVLEWMDALGLRATTPPNEDRDSREDIDHA